MLSLTLDFVYDDRFTKALVDKRTAPQAAPKNDMMQAWIKTGMSKDDLMQHAMAHM
jgi:hypothetical protein